MLSYFKKLLFGTKDTPRTPVFAEGLGVIEFNVEDGFWVTQATIGECPFVFRFDGEGTPNEKHFPHAKEIKTNLNSFQSMINTYLANETRELPDAADEILALKIEAVCLWVPEEPKSGMIYFNGPDEYRVWRCDYDDGKPVRLGFDS